MADTSNYVNYHNATNATNGNNVTNGDAPAMPEQSGVNQSVEGQSGLGQGPQVVSTSNAIEVLCGPLLNYKRMSNTTSKIPTWHGSVLIVTTPGQREPSLQLRSLGARDPSAPKDAAPPVDSNDSPEVPFRTKSRPFAGEKLYEDQIAGFWRFKIDLPLSEFETQWEYHIPDMKHRSGASHDEVATKRFFVPAATESMRIMFHSCNGFSVGTDEDAWSGCALWNDVLRRHKEKPLHVMIGGGDQIYNDGIRVSGPLREWCDIRNPQRRREHNFNGELRSACDKYYFDNYVRWYSTEPFASANGSIAQVNIWDDHDIIDGFGSYTDHFMKAAVFRGIGGIAHKYYLLFQHHVPCPPSTYTTDTPSTTTASDPRPDAQQLQSTYVMTEKPEDPSFIFGARPGPYVEESSRSVYCQLGAQVAFLGIDARTERTRHQINYVDTYDRLFNHVDQQLTAAGGNIKHFILLLGVPIAYPRLQWLENILQSPLMGGVRFLNKRFGVAGGLFNNFDGGVDLMDDLDDHYTAQQHKKERKDIILRLQRLAKAHSVRVTILGGDVHLAAFGRFYSRPDLGIPAENDHRFISNVISSAITNHPPPAAVANLLAKRNKIHHLDRDTDETLLNVWDVDPGLDPAPANADEKKAEPVRDVKPKTASSNHCTMPSRNYAILSLSHEQGTGAPSTSADPDTNGTTPGTTDATTKGASTNSTATPNHPQMSHHNHPRHISSKKGNPRNAQHVGEDNCGVHHPAANGITPSRLGGRWGLDVCYRVEVDNRDRTGATQGYGVSVPGLEVSGGDGKK